MISNTECAYCRVIMNRIPNHKNARSVEHMIPNISSLIQRNNGEGDFYICRNCNSRKSNMDEIFGMFTRLAIEGISPRDDITKFTKKVNDGNGKFVRAIKSVKTRGGETSLSIPISPRKTIEYFEFIGKGQYLINTGEIFDQGKFLITVEIFGHSAVRLFEKQYHERNKSNPFDDLTLNTNPNLFNLNGETFIICDDDHKNIFVFFNRVFLVEIRIIDNTRANQVYKNSLKKKMHRNWS